MILINNISKRFENKVIFENVNISFQSNINFIVGNNGVGKSTLVNIIAAALKADCGEIKLGNVKVDFNNGLYKKNVGFLLSFPSYPKHFKVKEFVELMAFFYDLNTESDNHFISELIEFFELNDFLNSKVDDLSLGYQKRVLLLVSMIHKPKYYIYDEPFSGLDNQFIEKLEQRILNLALNDNWFLITSHQISENFTINNSKKYIIDNNIIEEV